MRRVSSILLLTALVCGLVGCGDDQKKTVSPIAFDAHDRCHLCGMVISHYEGPKAEVFIKGVDEPIKFCSTRDAFTFALQPENKRRLTGMFVHDLGKTTWEKPQDTALTDAQAIFYVYGSKKEGVMGVEAIPFASKEKAEAFIKEYGGQLYSYKEITLDLLAKN